MKHKLHDEYFGKIENLLLGDQNGKHKDLLRPISDGREYGPNECPEYAEEIFSYYGELEVRR